jgi:hypothetical protein
MRNHRPGPGNYTPNWGATGDRARATDLWGSTPRVVLWHTPDPVCLDWAPGRLVG